MALMDLTMLRLEGPSSKHAKLHTISPSESLKMSS